MGHLTDTTTEQYLRYLLATGHSHEHGFSSMYWDDGEMQCSLCGCDFKTDTPQLLHTKIVAYNLKLWKKYLNE